MPYEYQTERPKLFTEEGQVALLSVRDQAASLIAKSGAFQLNKIRLSGDSWFMLACIDRLVELKELRCIGPENVISQNKVYTAWSS